MVLSREQCISEGGAQSVLNINLSMSDKPQHTVMHRRALVCDSSLPDLWIYYSMGSTG